MRNIEVLRNYFLGKDPQLKETMTDNSLRLIGIEGKRFVLRTELIKGLHDLREHVDEKDVELQGEIDGLIRDLSSETTARENADTQIYLRMGNIETTLREDLRLEILARISGDNQLNTKFNNYYTKAQVDQLISILPTFDIEVVQVLPTEDISETTIYLVPSQDPQAANSYDEFIYVSNNWEQIGSTAIDLSNYYTKTETDEAIEEALGTFGEGIKEITSSTAYVEDQADGVYKVSKDTTLKVSPTYTGLQNLYSGGYLFVKTNSSNFKAFVFLQPMISSQSGSCTMHHGYADGANSQLYSVRLNSLENIANKVTTMTAASTDTQYPSAKCVYDAIVANGVGIPTLTDNVVLSGLNTGAYYLGEPVSIYATSGGTLLYSHPSGSRYRYNAFMVVVNYTSNSNTARTCYIFPARKGSKVLVANTSYTTAATEIDLEAISTTAFTGTDGVVAGTIGLVPAPATTDDGKFLCADGTWQTSGGGTTITYGTTDLTPGVSPLAEGTFYFQYE